MSPASLAIDLAIIAAIGGLLSLDRRAAFQLMLSQPLVAVGIVGLAFGELETGILLGAILQLLWMSCVLFGANIPRNDTLASVTIGGAIILFGRYVSNSVGMVDPGLWAMAIMVGAPVCMLGQWLDVRLDHMNRKLAEKVDQSVDDERFNQLGFFIILALIRIFVANAAATAVTTAITFLVLMQTMLKVGENIGEALTSIGVYIIPALGLAVSLTMVRPRAGLLIAASTFIVVVATIMQGVAL